MTGHVIDLTKLGQIHIITYPKVDLSLIICQLINLIFLVNIPNQLFNQCTQSTFLINQPTIDLAAPPAYNILFLQIYIRRRVYFYLLSYV